MSEARPAPCGRQITLDTWEDAQNFYLTLLSETGVTARWIFRGQSKSDWPLRTTLERAIEKTKRPRSDLLDVERRIITHFRRMAHLHPEISSDDITAMNHFEICTKIQHHGGPTRLLDFTHSFWVAVFFALELTHGHTDPAVPPAVWAIESTTLWKQAWRHRALRKETREDFPWDTWDTFAASDRNEGAAELCAHIIATQSRGFAEFPLALPVESQKPTKRMAVQGGCFICPLGPAKYGFETCLFKTFGLDANGWLHSAFQPGSHVTKPKGPCGPRSVVLKVLLPSGWKQRIHGLKLLEGMNIHAATLFPDAYGLATNQYRHFLR